MEEKGPWARESPRAAASWRCGVTAVFTPPALLLLLGSLQRDTTQIVTLATFLFNRVCPFFFSFDKFLTDAFSSYTLPEINFNFTRNSPLSLTLYIQPLYRRVKPPVENLGQNCTSRDVFPSTNTKKQTKRNLKTINNKVSNTTK